MSQHSPRPIILDYRQDVLSHAIFWTGCSCLVFAVMRFPSYAKHAAVVPTTGTGSNTDSEDGEKGHLEDQSPTTTSGTDTTSRWSWKNLACTLSQLAATVWPIALFWWAMIVYLITFFGFTYTYTPIEFDGSRAATDVTAWVLIYLSYAKRSVTYLALNWGSAAVWISLLSLWIRRRRSQAAGCPQHYTSNPTVFCERIRSAAIICALIPLLSAICPTTLESASGIRICGQQVELAYWVQSMVWAEFAFTACKWHHAYYLGLGGEGHGTEEKCWKCRTLLDRAVVVRDRFLRVVRYQVRSDVGVVLEV